MEKGEKRLAPHMDFPPSLPGDKGSVSPGVWGLQSLGVQVKQAEKPTEEKEAREILARAFRDRQTVFPCGGGTSLSAGVLPPSVDLALDTTGMDKMVNFDPLNLNLEVSAGMTLDRINEFLAGQEKGFFLPLDPPWSSRATIGGAYAANSSGPLRLRYGTLRDLVLGVRGIDSRGREIAFGGKTVKNVSGYDLTKFLIGSAGSLCLVTSVAIRVYPLPDASSLCDLVFETREELEKFLAALRSSVLLPSAVLVTDLAGGPGVSAAAGIRFRVMIGFEGHGLAVDRQNRDLLKLAGEFGGLGSARTGRDMMNQGIRLALEPVRSWRDPLFLKVSVPIAQAPRTFVALRRLLHDHGFMGKVALCAANGVIFLYVEGVQEGGAERLVKDLRDLIPAGGGYVAPILAHRNLLQGWGARVEPALHQLAFQPIKDRLDPTGVFPPIL
jgi:FAD/FMN-containing dehydrogenase